jgi:hypothetical protein
VNLPPQNLTASEIAGLSHAAHHFDHIASGLIARLRRALGVPDSAEADVEQEFVQLRSTLDGFYPEFTRMYGELLLNYLGGDASVVCPTLSSPGLQAFLEAAPAIQADLSQALLSLVPSIERALTHD